MKSSLLLIRNFRLLLVVTMLFVFYQSVHLYAQEEPDGVDTTVPPLPSPTVTPTPTPGGAPTATPTVPPLPTPTPGGAPTATPTVTPLPSPTVTPMPTHASSCTLSIGQGAVFTGQLAVQIHTMVANAAEVQLSNDGGFSGAFWQPYADTINWTVSDPGQKIVTLLVYARFRDAAGNPLCNNSALTDDIIYDPLPPTVRIVALAPTNRTNGSATPPVAGVLTLATEDQAGGSGVAEMRLGYQADLSALPWVSFRDVTQLDHITGSTLFVEVRDGVGNRSVTVSRQFDMPGLLYLPLIKR